MSSFNQSFYTRMIYHTTEQITDKFNEHTTMDEIHSHVREKLGYCLRNPFIIQVHHPETKELITLNQYELDYRYNPFKLHPSINNMDIFSMFNMLVLYVVDYSLENHQTNQQPNSAPVAVAKESECQQDLSVKNNTNDLSGALLTHELNSLLVHNDHSLEGALVGNTAPMQNHLSMLIQNSNTQPNESERLSFSHDVKPVQKPIYMSDQFNQRDKAKTNGFVSRVQGIKIEQKAKSSVLPRIRVPRQYRQKHNAWLDIYAVYQKKLSNGKICWIKHPDKGFLPNNYTDETVPVNPISFSFNEMKLSKEDDYELPLRMTTEWDKSGAREEIIHQLDEKLVANLHPIVDLEPFKYDPCTPRLMGTIREGNITLWHTMCLSNYIRSTKISKRAASSTNITGHNNAKNCKRLKE